MAQTIFSRVSLFPVLRSLVLKSLASFSTAVICPLSLFQYIHNTEREQVVPIFPVMGCYILIGTSHLHPYVPPSTKQPKPFSSSLKPGNLPFSCFTAGSSLERNYTKKIFSTLEKNHIIWFPMEKVEVTTCSVIECLTGITKTLK